MFVKLTYYDKGTPTLVNLANVDTIYSVYDTSRGRISTKIQFSGGNIMNVEESEAEILKLYQDAKDGFHQSTDFPRPSIEELMKKSYDDKFGKRPEKNYNQKEHHHRP